jgi:hypothetical protein
MEQKEKGNSNNMKQKYIFMSNDMLFPDGEEETSKATKTKTN